MLFNQTKLIACLSLNVSAPTVTHYLLTLARTSGLLTFSRLFAREAEARVNRAQTISDLPGEGRPPSDLVATFWPAKQVSKQTPQARPS